MTRRGRVVFTTLAALPLIVWALVSTLGSGGAVAGPASMSGAELSYVTVQAGDSLWAIAEAVAPHDDPRDVIHEIARLNGLSSSTVEPGQRLAVPPQHAG